MKRIAVLVSGGGTNLQALIDAKAAGKIPEGEFAAVVASSPDAYALQRAEKAGIPTYVINRKDYGSNQELTIALTALLQEQKIDLIVLAGFMYILTGELVNAYPNAILNVHPALIPSFCGEGCYGLHVHEKALAYGVKVIWCHGAFREPKSAMAALSSFKKSVNVEEGDTPEVLQRRIMEAGRMDSFCRRR